MKGGRESITSTYDCSKCSELLLQESSDYSMLCKETQPLQPGLWPTLPHLPWRELTLMFLTRLAVLLATSLAACTKCLLATGLLVLLEACLQALHSTLVCLAITVAAARTWGEGPH